MNDQDARDPDSADEANDSARPEDNTEERNELTPSDAPRSIGGRWDEEPSAGLPLILPPLFWDGPNPALESARADSFRRRAIALAAGMVCVVALGAAAFVVVDHHRQASLLAERAQENAKLAETVSSLNTRMQTVENAKGRDELAELRRSVGEMKTAAVSSRELSAAIAQLSQRVERLDREQGEKLDKLGERVDHETNATTAEIAARLDKLEKTAHVACCPPAQGPAAEIRPERLDGADRLDRPAETDPSRLRRARRQRTTSR